MFHVVLFQPEIPANTGNIIRLCANAGAHLHLIQPLGFVLDDKRLKRAGLDYHEWANLQVHADFISFQRLIKPPRIFALSSKAQQNYAGIQYQAGDAFLFGPETRGLPGTLLQQFPSEHTLRIPMQPNNRSLNLSNAVAVMLYEAWRQLDFLGGM